MFTASSTFSFSFAAAPVIVLYVVTATTPTTSTAIPNGRNLVGWRMAARMSHAEITPMYEKTHKMWRPNTTPKAALKIRTARDGGKER